MTRKQKLFDSIRNNIKTVRFHDACTIAESLGFIHTAGKGSHRVFKRPSEVMQLNFQTEKALFRHTKHDSY